MSQNNKPYIGVTGITNVYDIEVIKKELGNLYGMYGILVSRNTLYGGKPHRNRYPDISIIKELFEAMSKNSLRTIHYNSHIEEEISKDIKEIINITDGLCNCVQLNIEYPPIDQIRTIKDENKDLKIIFQIGRDSIINMTPEELAYKIRPYIQHIDYILIDASGGAGVEMNIIKTREIAYPLRTLKTLTFAGGLNGSNLSKFILLIEEFDASIDAERRLMNDNDTLDHIKVTDYINIAKAIKRNIQWRQKRYESICARM